jgi:hypothetical protein
MAWRCWFLHGGKGEVSVLFRPVSSVDFSNVNVYFSLHARVFHDLDGLPEIVVHGSFLPSDWMGSLRLLLMQVFVIFGGTFVEQKGRKKKKKKKRIDGWVFESVFVSAGVCKCK